MTRIDRTYVHPELRVGLVPDAQSKLPIADAIAVAALEANIKASQTQSHALGERVYALQLLDDTTTASRAVLDSLEQRLRHVDFDLRTASAYVGYAEALSPWRLEQLYGPGSLGRIEQLADLANRDLVEAQHAFDTLVAVSERAAPAWLVSAVDVTLRTVNEAIAGAHEALDDNGEQRTDPRDALRRDEAVQAVAELEQTFQTLLSLRAALKPEHFTALSGREQADVTEQVEAQLAESAHRVAKTRGGLVEAGTTYESHPSATADGHRR
ncbi:MAG: hypothetical protein AAGD86_01530 [Pseudomonadota bacterium]